MPQGSEEVHRQYGLCHGSRECRDGSHAEQFAEESVGSGVNAVENDGDMRKEFGNDIEGTLKEEQVSIRSTREGPDWEVGLLRATTYPTLCRE
jgi:hypothetical protein